MLNKQHIMLYPHPCPASFLLPFLVTFNDSRAGDYTLVCMICARMIVWMYACSFFWQRLWPKSSVVWKSVFSTCLSVSVILFIVSFYLAWYHKWCNFYYVIIKFNDHHEVPVHSKKSYECESLIVEEIWNRNYCTRIYLLYPILLCPFKENNFLLYLRHSESCFHCF